MNPGYNDYLIIAGVTRKSFKIYLVSVAADGFYFNKQCIPIWDAAKLNLVIFFYQSE